MNSQGLKVLLSHHRDDQLHLCYRLGPIHLCARCSGLYPGMALALVVGHLAGPWPWWLEWGLLFFAPLPALIEWGLSSATGKPERRNWVRSATGFGLGVGLGTNLLVNTRDLLGYPVLAQLTYLLTFIWVIWMISYARRSSKRRRALAARMRRPGLEEFVLGQAQTADESEGDQASPPNKPQTK